MLSPKEQEDLFQKAMSEYDADPSNTSAYTMIWIRVLEACKANAKKMLKVKIPDDTFYDRLMDSVETVMRYILVNGKRPRKLITYCYLPTLGKFFGPSAKKEDLEYSYETSVENGYDIAVNEIGERIDAIRNNGGLYNQLQTVMEGED